MIFHYHFQVVVVYQVFVVILDVRVFQVDKARGKFSNGIINIISVVLLEVHLVKLVHLVHLVVMVRHKNRFIIDKLISL